MRLDPGLISEFRGRALSDYIPKKEFNRKGTKAKRGKHSYFADSDNKHRLNLLVCYCNKKIFGDSTNQL